MALLRQFLRRLLALFRSSSDERELSREIDAHLKFLEEEFFAKGMTSADAKLAARRAFGGVEQAKEHQRDARSFRWIDDLQRDSLYAIRSLKRSPAFTTAAVLTLAIGIGATTAIYSVVDIVLLRPLPFPDSDRLIRITENQRPRGMQTISFGEYNEWRSKTTMLSGLAAITTNPQALLMTRHGAIRVSGGPISTNYFEVMGINALVGRTILSSDDANLNVAVITETMWRRYFAGDPSVVGSTIELRSGTASGSRLVTVVGIIDERSAERTAADIYTPIAVSPTDRRYGLSPLVGRMKPGVTLAQASEEANAIGHALRPPRPESAPPLTGPRIVATSLKSDIVSTLQPALRVFLAAVVVVLLIVCANVANLLLARGTSRQREIAVRLAIGAGRGRIVRQIMAECLVLALIGGALGALLGAGGVALVKQLATVEAEGVWRLVFGATILPRASEVAVSGSVLLIALALAAITSVVFGLLPALQLSRTDHLRAMGSRGGGRGRHEGRIGAALVVGQLIMATVLLVGAGLLVNSFINLLQVEKGYDPRNVLAFQLVMPAEYATARKVETIETLLTKLRAEPRVRSAGFAYAGILIGIENTVGTFVPEGGTLDQFVNDEVKPRIKALSGGYFEAMGLRVLSGRGIDGRDTENAPPVVVLNRRVARRLFGDRNPVGAHVVWDGRTVAVRETANRVPVEATVVGVVEDVRQTSVDREAYPEVFMDYRQVIAITRGWGLPPTVQELLALGFMSFGIRVDGDPRELVPMVRRLVNDIDVNTGLDAITPMETLVGNSVARQRFYAVLLGTFALVAGVLAAIGIYGVLAYSVVQRTQEIGIRMALGAERRQVLGLVIRRGVILAVIGIVAGVAAAIAGAKYLESMLFGIQPRDPWTFVAVAVAFAFVSILASYFPARRATRVDPMVALRVD